MLTNIKYNFPNLRIGSICEALDSLEHTKIKVIVNEIKSNSEIYHKILSDVLEKQFRHSGCEELSGILTDEYEGTAIHSPVFCFDLRHGRNIYTVNFAATFIVCLSPVRNKVWARASLIRINKKPACDIGLNRCNDFFSIFRNCLHNYANNLFAYFNDCARKHLEEVPCNPIHTIEIRTVSSKNISELLLPISKEEPFSIIGSFNEKSKRRSIIDYLYFSLNSKIESVDKYKDFIMTYRDNWKNQLKELSITPEIYNSNQSIIMNGYQWFGYNYRNSHCLFLRREDLLQKSSYYYGYCSDSDASLQHIVGSKDPKSSARIASGGVVRNISRVI